MASRTLSAQLSEEQIKVVLAEIASCAGTLAELVKARLAEGDCDAAELHAFSMIAERIGSLADFAIDDEVIGDFPAWMCGEAFHAARSAPDQLREPIRQAKKAGGRAAA